MKIDKDRIYYEGMIDFCFKERRDLFVKQLNRLLNKYFYPSIIYKYKGNVTLEFYGVAHVHRKSHIVDEALKSLLNRYKSFGDIRAIKIDKVYMSNPIMLSAYIWN